MADTEINWTFDTIPPDGDILADEGYAGAPEPPPSPRGPGPPRPQPPLPHSRAAWRARLRHHTWRLAGGGVLFLLAAAALTAYYVTGWRHLRDQLTQEVLYEDAQARAGQVDAVLAMQSWESPAWRDRRAAEAELGLAAPLPADPLRPLPEPPTVRRVDSLAEEAGDFSATVARRYVDSAGQVYTFVVDQRYHQRGPGLWQREAPDPAAFGSIREWTGARLTATYPAADARWLEVILPQVDAHLTAACAEWQCAPAASVAVTFTAQLDQLPRPRASRALDEGPAGGYPFIFDLPFRNPRYPPRIILPALAVAGAPADEAAAQALVHAYTADLLGQLAGDIVVGSRSQYRYFLDGLIARMEIKLGLAGAPPRALRLDSYVAVQQLWGDLPGNSSWGASPQLAPRLEVLWFLNEALADQPPGADAALINHLRWQLSPAHWLNESLGIEGEQLIAAYEAGVRAELTGAPPDWEQLAGLVYTCDSTLTRVQAGEPMPLAELSSLGWVWLSPQALSLDGRYLAVVADLTPENDSDSYGLVVVDTTTPAKWQVVTHEWPARPVGWSADGQLIYLMRQPEEVNYNLYDLFLFDPPTGERQHVQLDPLMIEGSEPNWSADHRQLSVTFGEPVNDFQLRGRPSVLTFHSPPSQLNLDVQGHAPALAPNGRWLVYAAPRNRDGYLELDEAALTFLELTTAAAYQVQLPDLLTSANASVVFETLTWSPDGRQLAITARTGAGLRLYTLRLRGTTPGAGADLQWLPTRDDDVRLIGFSADGQYLGGYADYMLNPAGSVEIFDTATGELVRQVVGHSAAWSPQGHTLAVAGEAGLYSLDPATATEHWIAGGACQVIWPAAD